MIDPRPKTALVVLAWLLAGASPGCASKPPSAGAAATPKSAASADREPDPEPSFAMNGQIGTYVSTPWTFSTNSFVIAGPTGLVLVDLQFTPSQALRLAEEAERATRKKTALAVVLHPNPDKFNGTATLQRRGVRVVTSAQVLAAIPAVYRQRTEAFLSRYAPDWPSTTPVPESFGDKTTELEAGGTKIRLHVLGPGCSAGHVVVEWDGDDGKHVFVGDLVGNGVHAWLELGLTDEWLARLAEIRALKPRFVHPGRGDAAGVELVDRQEKYIRDVVRLVDAEQPAMPIPDGAIERVKTKVLELYPDHGFEVFLRLGLPAVWEQRAKKTGRAAKGA